MTTPKEFGHSVQLVADEVAHLVEDRDIAERLAKRILTVVMEPPRWGRHHPSHMKGWEAFGVVPGDSPIVRQLGTYSGGGKPGTTPWGAGEVKLGVAGVEIITSADHTAGAYVYVVGTEKEDVERRWHIAAALFTEHGGALWPTSR